MTMKTLHSTGEEKHHEETSSRNLMQMAIPIGGALLDEPGRDRSPSDWFQSNKFSSLLADPGGIGVIGGCAGLAGFHKCGKLSRHLDPPNLR
jgi:hypothetical protein